MRTTILECMRTLLLCLLLIIACGCSQQPPTSHPLKMQQISGRGSNRPFLYRIKVPETWIRKDPPQDQSLIDTTKSIVEFLIQENDTSSIRIAIHNFPAETIESRIPPEAQIARWKRQFAWLDQTRVSVIPQSFSGYVGLLFEGSGTINGELTTMLGWCMQIAPEHFRTLSHPLFSPEMRADITIKATGPKDLMERHRTSIAALPAVLN